MEYDKCLSGNGQNYPISSIFKINGKKIEICNNLCIDDFERYLIDWCIFVAEQLPETDFNATGNFIEDTGGSTINHKMSFKNGILTVNTVKEDDWGKDKIKLVFCFEGKKLSLDKDKSKGYSDYLDEDPNDDDKYGDLIFVKEITDAWKYEDELDAEGVLPNEVHDEDAWDELPRVKKRAEEGDEKAISILEKYNEINDTDAMYK
ncbi:hypothetical protein [Butyrivibrio sp. AD3002]|uniref:hypothetical protein n=1 Tax=Butyrivibrio sp. AD3002 TaxID=1280670 RepID=UPI0012DEF712|nr:hypothetical protein [Butyrivibrio sp. AD3002]